jgi:membrane protease YdiL (CAAX protease family)
MSTVSGDRPFLRTAVALVSALGLGAGGLMFGFLLTLLSGLVLIAGMGMELTPSMQIVLGLVFVQGVGCAGVALAYVGVRPKIAPTVQRFLGVVGGSREFRIPASVPDLRDLTTVGVGYALALFGALAGSVLVSQLSVETGTNQAAEIGMESPETLLLLIPASILIIGPGEELLFRGVVQGRLREVFRPVLGVFVPSVVFAGLHWFALSGGSPSGNLVVLGVLVVPAMVFGAAYEYTSNIVVPSLIHGLYNATLFSALYYYVTSDQLPAAVVGVAGAL